MAEAASAAESHDQDKGDGDALECAVCLQTCIHPAKLPCGHVFCFLCIKGIANQSKRCAMCRQEIPTDFIDQPNLLPTTEGVDGPVEDYDGGYQWFYEGRNGWWQYDERTSKELEISYKAGDRTCELLIAGFLYVTDLEAMLQLRRNDPSRRRRIKRDLATIPKKGIAGLRIDADPSTLSHPDEAPLHPSELHSQSNTHTGSHLVPIIVNTDQQHSIVVNPPSTDLHPHYLTPVTPSNTPQSPTSGRTSPSQATDQDLRVTMDRIRALRVTDNGSEDNNGRASGRRMSRDGTEVRDVERSDRQV